MISEQIYSLLQNMQIAGIVGDRIYPVRIPEGTNAPFLLYALDTRPQDTKDGNDLDILDFDIACFGTYQEMLFLEIEIKAVFDFYSSGNIDKIIYEASRQGYDEKAELYRFDISYTIRNKK